MALELEKRLSLIGGLKITQKVESNGIFVIMPREVAETLRREYFFYPWNEELSEYRLMTSWDTSLDEIEHFSKRLDELMHPGK